MLRKIITISQEKCDGCGICVNACHEGAIGIKDKKAVLLREDYCDGLGDCLPACPKNAIKFEQREAEEYNEAAVKENLKNRASKSIKNSETYSHTKINSQLSQWPVQIKLAPVKAPYFDGCKLLIAADCTAFAYGNFHNDFISGHITLIGCPKLDMVDYSEKLSEIIKQNDIQTITIVKMNVPCCNGIENAVKKAIANSKTTVPVNVFVVTTDGKLATH